MTPRRRTRATGVSATRAGRLRPSHIGPRTFIGVMFGGDPAKRGKIATDCAKRPAGRDLLKGPTEVLGPGLFGHLFA